MRSGLEDWIKSHSHYNGRSSAALQLEMLMNLQKGKDDEVLEARVVSVHFTKSITLPVVEIGIPRLGLKIFSRDNFYDTAFSVKSESPITGFDTSHMRFDSATSRCFEGFERGHVPIYGPYDKDNRRFSAHSGVELDIILNRLIACLA